MKKLSVRQRALCGVVALCVMPAPVLAQQEASGGLEEIVVTANKRQESLNKVGLTVNVLSADVLRNRQISTIQDLTATVPSMSYAETPTSSPIISVRGVGFFDTTLSATPTVSLYMNQVPLAYPIMAGHGIFDLQQLEVMKGPQGILFGQNSTGGAINYVPAAPTDTLQAGITVGYGSFNRISQEAYISGPISDTLRVRVSERTVNQDGWQKSLTRPGDRNGKVKTMEGRVLVEFQPSDGAKFQLNVNGWTDKGQPQAAHLIGFNVQIPGAGDPDVLASPLAPRSNRAADWVPGLPKRNNSFFQASLRGDIEILDGVTLTSVSAYSKLKQNERISWDGTALPEQLYDPEKGNIRSLYQELRLSNGGSGALRWMIGGNYQDDKIYQYSFYKWNVASTSIGLGLFDNGQNIFYVHQKTKSEAAFANLEYDIVSQITLKGGIRYTKSKLSTDNCGADITAPYLIGQLFYGAGNYTPGACFPFNDLGVQVGDTAPFTSGRFIDKESEDSVSWKLGLDWKPSNGTLVYANVSKGYKGGGFPSIGASVFSQFLKLKQESVLDYEIGTKLSMLDRRLQLNAAAFYYDYRNKQLRARNIDPIWGNLDVVQNIPKSSVKGLELEITARPTDALTLMLGGSYIKGKIKKFSGVNAAGIVADFAGTPMPYSPKWNLTADAQYEVPITDAVKAFAGVNVTYRSKTISVVGGDQNPPNATPNTFPLFGIDSYSLVNLRAGVEGDKWRVEVWGKNVFNKYYWNTAYPAFDTITRYTGMPATFGVNLSYKM